MLQSYTGSYVQDKTKAVGDASKQSLKNHITCKEERKFWSPVEQLQYNETWKH